MRLKLIWGLLVAHAVGLVSLGGALLLCGLCFVVGGGGSPVGRRAIAGDAAGRRQVEREASRSRTAFRH